MINNKLKGYLATLQKTESILEKELEELNKLPQGKLIVSKVKGKFIQCFFAVGSKKSHKKYIPKKDWSIAYGVAQREYDESLLAFVQKQKQILRDFQAGYEPYGMREVYLKIPEAKRLFVKPLVLPDDDFVAQWYQMHPGNQNPIPYTESYPTERGEKVRSKSEKIIADKLFYLGIPYVYEAELQLGRNSIYPDFTILNVRTRDTKYLEHFGRMDDPAYGKKVIKRLDLFHSNGIWEGENLFYTMENSIAGWDMMMFEKLVKRYFL